MPLRRVGLSSIVLPASQWQVRLWAMRLESYRRRNAVQATAIKYSNGIVTFLWEDGPKGVLCWMTDDRRWTTDDEGRRTKDEG